MKYNVVFHPEPEGGYTAVVPSLPGCVTYGKDLKTTRKMVLDAISAYVASLNKHKEEIPSDEESFIALVDVERSSPTIS